ncbi:MAG: iron ABC transporter [Arcobacter sp.]|nr:MAG: iron ABC transporter [Arcobacter sp.]
MNAKKLFIIMSVLTIFVALVSIMLGGADISIKDIANFFIGDLEGIKRVILVEIRLPRIVMAFLIGMLLATSGVVSQGVFLNPLADPYIIGIAASATFGAVLAFLLGLPEFWYGVFAFISSAILSFVIFTIYQKAQNIATLLIIGIAFSSFLGAFTSFATYMIGEQSFKIVAWMMGYLGSATWSKIGYVSLPLILSILYFYTKRYELNIILSGDEEAKSLGVDVVNVKRRLLIVSSLAVSFSVAFTGMIGFVGLMIPHILRTLLRTSNNVILIPLSTIAGGLFLLLCDNVGKSILSPTEVPIGVVTSFFGAPFFLYLALKSGKKII